MADPSTIDSPGHQSPLQKALEAFLSAASAEEMEAVVEEYPFVTGPQFENGVERLIEHAARVGEPESMFHIQEQMELLHRVIGAEQSTPVEEAVEDFLYAMDEETAAEVFAEEEALLRSDQAEDLLFSMEAGDPESHLHLEERRALWRRLVDSQG